MKIKKGDKVKVLLGKDRGREGTVEKVSKTKGVFVAGVNVFKRHVKKQGEVEGGIIEVIKPMNISNVALVCPNCGKATRVGFRVDAKDKARICKKCGREI